MSDQRRCSAAPPAPASPGTAVAGDYGYEPTGMIHDFTNFVEDTVFFFTNQGPVQFIDDADNTVDILDWQAMLAIEAASRALETV